MTGTVDIAQRRARRCALFASFTALACAVSAVLASAYGPLDIPLQKAFSTLVQHIFSGAQSVETTNSIVVWEIRFSRIILSLLIGSGLAISGTVFQGILRNPLADPFTIGVSSGAAFGASVAIFFGLSGAIPHLAGVGVVPLAALIGALLALGAVITLGSIGGQLKRDALVLAGVVVATFLAALISLIKSLDEDSVASIVFWIMGSLQGRTWQHVQLILPWYALGIAIIWRFSRELDILSLGETQAQQLGMNASRVRLWLLIGASMITGASVAVSGVIGFVGLVVPHLVRLIQGGEHRPLLVSSAFIGGLLLLWSDVLARTILPEGAELPVGVVTALLGGPFFCLLLHRTMKRSSQ
ncbi:FecCD family ABC transporter permease [Halodesulfovibrio marinisediminis]|uniref:Iron complex transport system permease protein n=1 Tax=Halodesulfovibrio marinisediminis DSM 17456 TaxID=1121457 RepID=A0A1N6H217_9BACT|nr:iron ABC transporter permease [Halodesulfovibrio marinisediminis]SIO13868.1 iron complex transport system permease protein [Halodesulfovibrio marinisediminis DSM 17456]